MSLSAPSGSFNFMLQEITAFLCQGNQCSSLPSLGTVGIVRSAGGGTASLTRVCKPLKAL